MDSTENSFGKNSRGLASPLVSAVREWMVILMLLIDSVFSFFITKCANCWKLCTPCVLCSRLDHVFSDEKRGYIWDLICHCHKNEISSLVLCHIHNKLVDVHGLCENCLFSFATINKSNAETYRLLVAKLREDPYSRFDNDPLRQCSCCYEPWVSRLRSRELMQAKSIGFEADELDKEEDKEGKDIPLVSARVARRRNHGVDDLAHIGYRELKITSDTESEVPFSEEEDDEIHLVNEKDEYRVDLEVKDLPSDRPVITLGHVLALEKLINPISTEECSDLASLVLQEEPSILVPELLLDDKHPLNSESAEFSHPSGHGLEELNWEQSSKAHDPPQSDLISLDNAPDSSAMESKHDLDIMSCSEGSRTETVDSNKNETFSIPLPETVSREIIPVSNDPVLMIPNLLELGEAYKLAISNRGKQISGLLAEQWTGKDSSRVSEDLRVLLSQLSFTRGIEQTMNEVTPSPRFSINSDEMMKTNDGLQILQRRISLERNESGLSVDGSIVSEIEGESLIDRLKRQIEHGKRLMSSLYKELEEERNASAISANQAMAMITRLQEEKATLNMEALQYLRMMEEQTEYDDEALQKANDILAEKEKELQDMEAELEYYRNKYPNESLMENIGEIHDVKARDIGIVHSESSQVDRDSSNHENSSSRNRNIYDKLDRDKDVDVDVDDENNALFDFEHEKLYITHRLKELEKMLHLFSNNGKYVNFDGGEESIELDHIGQSSRDGSRRTDTRLFELEISNLNHRLEILEADRLFLEHTINSLKNEEMGLQFVREIASDLRELRKIGVRGDQTLD